METEPANPVEAIFSEALNRSDSRARQAYLVEACRERPALLQEITELLEANDAAPGFLAEAEPSAPLVEEPPSLAGFRILRPLGKGGLGTVYEAYDEKLQ